MIFGYGCIKQFVVFLPSTAAARKCLYAGLIEVRAGWTRTGLYTAITMPNIGQNPVQATTYVNSGRDDVNIRVRSALAQPTLSSITLLICV